MACFKYFGYMFYFQNMCILTCGFSRKYIRIVLLAKRFKYCCPGIYFIETTNLIIYCMKTLPDGRVHVSNGKKSFNFIKYCYCFAHFSKGKT